MGLGGISIWQLLIILAIVVMVFGTKKLRNLGSDVGALKGFKTAMKDDEAEKDESEDDIEDAAGEIVDAAAEEEEEEESVK